MDVSGAIFEDRDPAMPPGWLLTVTVQGSGFHDKAEPLLASVGSVPVECIFVNPEGTEFSGMLRAVPQIGEVLTVGFLDSPQSATTITFTLPPIV